MVRTVLGFVGILGALGVSIAVLSADNPLQALRAIGVGVAMLVFVTALGLADFVHVAHRVEDSIQKVTGTASHRRDGIKRVRHALRVQDAGGGDEEVESE
jgi:hypothetical protein